MSGIKYTMIALLAVLMVVIMGLEGNGLGLALAVMISGVVCGGLFICLVKIEAFDFLEDSELERLSSWIRQLSLKKSLLSCKATEGFPGEPQMIYLTKSNNLPKAS